MRVTPLVPTVIGSNNPGPDQGQTRWEAREGRHRIDPGRGKRTRVNAGSALGAWHEGQAIHDELVERALPEPVLKPLPLDPDGNVS